MPSFNQKYRNGLEQMGPGMGRFCSKGFALSAFLLAAVMQAANPLLAQNINDLLTIFGGDGPSYETSCPGRVASSPACRNGLYRPGAAAERFKSRR